MASAAFASPSCLEYCSSLSRSFACAASGTLLRYAGVPILPCSFFTRGSSSAMSFLSFLSCSVLSTAPPLLAPPAVATDLRSTNTFTASLTILSGIPSVSLAKSAPAPATSKLEAKASVAKSSVCFARASCASEVEHTTTNLAGFLVRWWSARSDRAPSIAPSTTSMAPSTDPSLHANAGHGVGHWEIMIEAGSPDRCAVPRPGRRCQSSSVTNGQMGWRRRRPVSKHVHSTAREWLRRPSASGVADWLYTLGLMSSRYTSHSLPLKNVSNTCTHFPNSYSLKHLVTSCTHSLSLPNTHRSRGRAKPPRESLIAAALPSVEAGPALVASSWPMPLKGTKSPKQPSMKRVACQSLLQKFRYPTTRLMSRLMSRPCTVYASKPMRRASAPQVGMPLVSVKSKAKSFFAFSTSFNGKFPPSTLACKASSSMP
mmetsp:Transcript_50285/g.86115  ORF Transcript_50285/g.86115 Transcript_50285/m.86115 type:complete len:429 (-) Transcript_50285:1773-3059(-)